MAHLRKYGRPPFSVAVLHGGPGAAGEMAPVARELSSAGGVLEPFQSESSIHGQVEELCTVLTENGDLPVTLIGFSWGAWLGFIMAARYPGYVKKLVVVGSGPFEEKYAVGIHQSRLRRLDPGERAEVGSLGNVLNDPAAVAKAAAFRRLGALLSKADTYDSISGESADLDLQVEIYLKVWPEAAILRKSGELLQLAGKLACPVVAIHGDYDSHPAEGVQKPLAAVLKDFRFILLKNCGHKPWIERQAAQEFYRVLKTELP